MKRSEVIGQEEAWQRLMGMVDENRVPHALLFCGPAGCGKMALALAFASYLLGERDGDESEAARRTTAMLAKWEHPDLHFSYPTIKLASWPAEHKPVSLDFVKEWQQMLTDCGPYLQLDEWMKRMATNDSDLNKQAIITAAESEAIAHNVNLMSSQGGYKISLIWLAERMNKDCANKLLKLLEEPPKQTVFILVSEAPELLLETIRSRTQRIDLKKIDSPALEQALVDKRRLSPDDARRLARIANGNWNQALQQLTNGNENEQFFDLFTMLMRLAYMRKIRDLKKWCDIVAAFGREKQKRMLDYFMHMLRESFMYNFGQQQLVYMTQQEEDFAKNFARFINEANVIDLFNLLDENKKMIMQNANPKILFFDMVLKIIVLLIRK